jgi:hypothetical protein
MQHNFMIERANSHNYKYHLSCIKWYRSTEYEYLFLNLSSFKFITPSCRACVCSSLHLYWASVINTVEIQSVCLYDAWSQKVYCWWASLESQSLRRIARFTVCKKTVFWDISRCSIVDHRRFIGAYWFRLHGAISQKVIIFTLAAMRSLNLTRLLPCA